LTAYVVLRGSQFHFRIRVPTDLVAAFGKREVRMSLRESRRRHATLKATQLVPQAQSLFSTIRVFMKHLTTQQVAELVSAWRDRMIERDAEIRRKIEVGLHRQSLQDYADHCAASADVFERLLEDLTPPVASDHVAHTPTMRERNAAYRSAAEAMTGASDPESDMITFADSAMLANLDDVSRLDLAKNYLAAGAALYSQRAYASTFLSLAKPTVAATRTEAPPPTAPASKSLSEAWAAFRQDKARTSNAWKTAVPEKAALAFKDFIELVGDKPIREVSRADCTRFREFQEKRPKFSVRRYKHLTADQLERLEIEEKDRQSSTNAGHKIGQFVSFFRWCEREQEIDRSPAEKLTLSNDNSKTRQPWSPEEIRTLLSSVNLREHSGMGDSRSTLGYFPWVVLLGAYTGARLGEIVNVRVQDFVRRDPDSDGEVPVMIVDEYEGKSVKTGQARRKIPLHPDLETLGLWEYIAVRERKGEQLLLDCKMKSGSRSKEASQRFTKYSGRLGLHVEHVKVFHSFRHAFKTKLQGYIGKDDADLVLGHKRQDSTDDGYTHPLQMSMHRHYEAIKQLTFGLELTSLRDLLLSSSHE